MKIPILWKCHSSRSQVTIWFPQDFNDWRNIDSAGSILPGQFVQRAFAVMKEALINIGHHTPGPADQSLNDE